MIKLNKTIAFVVIIATIFCCDFSIDAAGVAASQCNDGRDNDGDGKCDAIVGKCYDNSGKFNGYDCDPSSGFCPNYGTCQIENECIDGSELGDSGCDDKDGELEYYDNKMMVTDLFRITHPYYHMNQYYGQGQWHELPWNKDFSKILLYEVGPSGFDPSFDSRYIDYPIGRTAVWANIEDLKDAINWADLDDWLVKYQRATKEIPKEFNTRGMHWSINNDEDDILIATNNQTKKLVKYNVVSKTAEVIASIPTISSNAYINGFTIYGEVVITNDGQCSSNKPSNPGYLVDTSPPYKVIEFNDCPTERQTSWEFDGRNNWYTWPRNIGIHNSASPSGKYRYGSTGSCFYKRFPQWIIDDGPYTPRNVIFECIAGSEASCYEGLQHPDMDNCPDNVAHNTWITTDDWFIGGNVGQAGSPERANKDYDYKITQIMFYPEGDGFMNKFRHNRLLTYKSAGYWCIDGNPHGKCHEYHGLPSPSLRKDLRQIHFPSTAQYDINANRWEGKYGFHDFNCCENPDSYLCAGDEGIPPTNKDGFFSQCNDISENWGTAGIFLADIKEVYSNNPADVNQDTRVNIKDIQEVIRCIININSCAFPGRSNVNGDGNVNIKDIQEIIKKIINQN